jgi:hypothetical protein
MSMIIKLTRHALERMIARGITLNQVKRAIQLGATVKQTDGYESSYSYFLISWKKYGDTYIVKTVKVKE